MVAWAGIGYDWLKDPFAAAVAVPSTTGRLAVVGSWKVTVTELFGEKASTCPVSVTVVPGAP